MMINEVSTQTGLLTVTLDVEDCKILFRTCEIAEMSEGFIEAENADRGRHCALLGCIFHALAIGGITASHLQRDDQVATRADLVKLGLC